MGVFACKKYELDVSVRTHIMGILNVTPDSFSDGGDFFSPENALAHALDMVRDGADIIDIGAQSTRPGNDRIQPEDELSRLLPVLKAVRAEIDVPISVDTFYPSVARAALENGADILNDVTGFENEEMIAAAKDSSCGCILMRWRKSADGDIVKATREYLQLGAHRLIKAGIDKSRICLDPGIGFNMDENECLTLIQNTNKIKLKDYPYLAAVSRKRVIGAITGEADPKNRLAGTLAAHSYMQLCGANIIRAHDVKEAVRAARAVDAIMGKDGI